MAIFRHGGGNAGIKDYLENGKKQGRELHRDQIDKRVILEGDLEVCDRIIHSRETQGERYDHITLSFYENDISEETLRAISADFKAFAGAAYGNDELYFYAEAHMPKTAKEKKWNSEAKRYEMVDRKPHIHFVIPKTNVVTGGYASVFEKHDLGYGTKVKTREFLDAFQEIVNKKYGLASPKDKAHKRHDFTGKAEILSRVKEDVFTGKNREALTRIRDMMIAQKIETPKAFRQMLATIGEVSVGHGKDGDYLQVRLHGEAKNVRLKNYQFSDEFVSLPTAQKLGVTKEERSPEALHKDRTLLLQKWNNRAREIKYITASSKLYLRHYVKATDVQKTEILDRMEVAFYAKLAKSNGYFVDGTHAAALSRLAGPSVLTRDQLEAVSKHLKVTDWDLVKGESERATGLEGFSSAKLNVSYLRTTDELEAAQAAGAQIIEAPSEVIDTLTFSQSYFSEAALERHLLKHTADQAQYNEAMQAILACPELVVHGDGESGLQFTSRAIVAIENRLVDRAQRMAVLGGVAVSEAGQKEVSETRAFNKGQGEAFTLLCSGKQLAVVNGAAGTGKSFVLAAMREAYEKEGFEVYGAILQGKTAEDLERDSGIQSRTIARMLIDLAKGNLKLNSKSVLVVDEAGMVGSRDLEKLMGYVEEAGARLRLVGDAKQLAAVEYGNAFVEVSKRSEVASLTEIMRQKSEWMRKASEKFSVHDIDGLRDYIAHDLVHIEDTMKDAQIALVASWSEHRKTKPEESRIVLAHTNASRVELNDMMRATLKAEGHLRDEIQVTTKRGKIPMAPGEQVMFTRADRELGVKNGTTGTIKKISAEGVITVALENGKTTQFNAFKNEESGTSVDYGYAVTVHKSQGMTLDKAFVLADEGMSKENLGVAMTRHRYEAELYGSAEQFSNFENMVKVLDRSGRKAFSAEKEWTSEHRKEDSVIGQYVANLNARKAVERAAKTAEFKEIALNLDPKRVLDYLSKSHSIDPAQYPIVIDAKGRQRIQVGEHAMGVATFLTRAMHLNYRDEAAPILKQCYAEQLSKAYSQPRRDVGKDLDQSLEAGFAQHQKGRAAQYKSDREGLDSQKRETKKSIQASDLPTAEKAKALVSLSKAITAQKKELKATYDRPNAAVYKDYLAERAPKSAKHLAELARVSITPADKARLEAIEVKLGIVPGLQHLTPQQLQKGIADVINRSQDQGRPPAHILARGQAQRNRLAHHLARSEERGGQLEAEGVSGVHELPNGGLDAPGQISGVLLPGSLHGGVGDKQARKDSDVRRTGAGEGGRHGSAGGLASEPDRMTTNERYELYKQRKAELSAKLDAQAITSQPVQEQAIHDPLAEIRSLAEEGMPEENKGKPVIQADTKEWAQYAGTIIASNETHVAIAERDHTTIHEIKNLRITTDGNAKGVQALANGNAAQLLYKRGKDDSVRAVATITEKRKELQREIGNSRGL